MKWLTFFSAILLVSCQPQHKKEETSAAETPIDSAILTQEQLKDGWKLLFNGKTLDGWRTFKNQPNNSWEVVNGTLHCQPFDSANLRSDLITVEQYENFELQFDWKIGYQGNSGVIFRASEEFEQPYLTGPEYQLLDDVGYPGESKASNMTGANYDMQAPEKKKLNPQGDWNTSKLIVNGNQVEHWLNGDRILSYELGSEDWKHQKANCKWNDIDSYGTTSRGYIDLQDHSSEVWFKNIMIRVL